MFDFEKLTVYSKAKDYNKKVHHFISNTALDRTTIDQLRRASFSIMLNIAEGTGRSSIPDKRRFLVMSRGSAFECVAIFDFLQHTNQIDQLEFQTFYKELDELSRMLFSLMKNLRDQ